MYVCMFTRQEKAMNTVMIFYDIYGKTCEEVVTIHGYTCNSDKDSYNQLGCIHPPTCRPNAEQSNGFPFFS